MNALNIVKNFFPNVESVKDAKESVTIEVTRRDRANGERRNHRTCALAVACKRAMGLDGVIIGRTVVYLIKDNKALRYDAPPSISREVTAFDRGASFEPGIYGLSRPVPRMESRSGPKNGEKKRRIKSMRHVTQGIRTLL